MSRSVCILLACLTISGCTSRLYMLPPIDLADLQRSRPEAARLAARHGPAGHAAAYFFSERVLEHEVMPASGYWTLHGTIVRRYVVIDPHDQDATTFGYTTDENEELVQAELAVLPPDGPPRRYSRDVLVRQPKSKGRTSHKFVYPAVTRGTVIEERIETNFGNQVKDPNLDYVIPLQRRWPCQRARAVFAYPSEWGVEVKHDAAGKRIDYQVNDSHGQRVISYERSELPGLKQERFAPYHREDGVHLRLAMTLVKTASFIYYSPLDWKALGAVMRKHVVDNDAIFSRSVGAAAEEVTRGIVDPLKKLEAVVAHVQRTIQLAQYEPRDFATVLKTRRGSPYQIVGLAHRMLRKLGIDVDYLLIHSAKDGAFDKTFVHTEELNAPAVLAKIGGKTHLAMPQHKWLPVGVVPSELQGRPAVRIDDSGFAGFLTAPVLDESASRVDETLRLTVTPDGAVKVQGERVLRGHEAYAARQKLAQLKPAELQREVKLQRPAEVSDLHVDAVNLQALDKPLVLRFRYTAGSQLALSPGEAVLQTAGVLAARSVAVRPYRRQRAVYLHAGQTFARHVELRFPAGWSLQTKLAGGERTNRFGEARLRYETSDGLLRLDQSLKLRRQRQPASAYEELRSLIRLGRRLRVPPLVFTVATPASTASGR